MALKALFVGLGSAGQRHLRNLLELCGEDVEVMAYRYHKSEIVFTSDMRILDEETLTKKYKIREFEDYRKALDMRPDIVFVTNPNSLHMQYAVKAAECGYDLFIEKPLCTTLEETDKLTELVKKKNIICQIGYQYRYHPSIRMTREYLEKKKLGRIVSAHAEMGERITMMHRWEDYRGMIEARSELGGGVVLCQIHELDFLQWLFGVPDKVYSIGGKKGEFDIDVEDIATTLFRYDDETEKPAVTLHQDFFQYPPVRRCRIIGTKGRITMDLLGNSFLFEEYETGEHVEKQFNEFSRNDMFVAELRDFLDCVKDRKEPDCNVISALASTKIGLAVKKAFGENREIEVNG